MTGNEGCRGRQSLLPSESNPALCMTSPSPCPNYASEEHGKIRTTEGSYETTYKQNLFPAADRGARAFAGCVLPRLQLRSAWFCPVLIEQERQQAGQGQRGYTQGKNCRQQQLFCVVFFSLLFKRLSCYECLRVGLFKSHQKGRKSNFMLARR